MEEVCAGLNYKFYSPVIASMRGELSAAHIDKKRTVLTSPGTFRLIPPLQKNQEQNNRTNHPPVPAVVKTPPLGGPKLQSPEPGGPGSLGTRASWGQGSDA